MRHERRSDGSSPITLGRPPGYGAPVAEKVDVWDGLAAILYAQAGIFDILLGAWSLLTVRLAGLGIVLLLLALGSFWVVQGIVDRNGGVWWVGVALAVLSLMTPLLPVPNLTPYLPNSLGALVGLGALAYWVVRRRSFGLGVHGATGY